VACPACGNVARSGARFCDNCGQRLAAAASQAAGSAQPAATAHGPAGLAAHPGAAAQAHAGTPHTQPSAAHTHSEEHSHASPAAHTHPGEHAHASAPAHTHSDEHSHAGPAAHTRASEPAPGNGQQSAGLYGRAQTGAEGERRVVTMLFCDVKGSTAAASQLDPEEWADIMNGAFSHLIAPVYRYEGTVARLMGDAILAFFGAPVAHEDDPQRAVLAGLEIVRDIQPYREQIRQRWGLDFNVRVGINTGLVMVGTIGSDQRMEYSALGDAINLAARMEQTAEPGTVQISGDTHRLVRQFFEFEDLGGIRVKGKDEPVRAWRVVGLRASPGALRGADGFSAPLTGREREMALMRQAMQSVLAGRGQVVCLQGEAGLGKSRLLRELRADWQQAAGRAGRWLETASLSYEMGQPYGLFQRLVRAACGASDNEAPDSLRTKLAELAVSLLPARAGGLEQALPALKALFGLPPPAGQAPLEGESFKNQLFALMPGLLRGWAAEAPAALVFDDLHWADPASIALLQHLFPLAWQARLLIVCALRPDDQAPSAGLAAAAQKAAGERFSQLEIRPLPEDDSATLVNRLLDDTELPADLRRRILQRAEGNPFFVEEVVRTLIDSGALAPAPPAAEGPRWLVKQAAADIELPESLHSLLSARIDRLDEPSRRTLQLAAIIGRSFYQRVLGAILEAGAELDARLANLQQAGLIQQAAVKPEVEYTFRHALMHEAAYQTILRRHRREFHRRVGEALEGMFPDRAESNAAALAFHFEEAGDVPRALKYSTLAGDTAFKLYANAEAVGHYERAIKLARRVETNSHSLAHLFERRGRALELLSRFKEALLTYAELEALGKQREDSALVLRGITWQAKIKAMQTTDEANAPEAEALLAQALRLAQELGDREAEARVHWILTHLYNWAGRISEARAAGERSLALARQAGLVEQAAYTLNDLTYIYLAQGQVAELLPLLEEAAGLWKQLDNTPMLANSRGFAANVEVYMGLYDQALEHAGEAFGLSSGIHNWWGMAFSNMSVGLVQWDRGDPALAAATMQSVLGHAERSGFLVPKFSTRILLAEVYASVGNFEAAAATLQQIPQAPEDQVEHYALGMQACRARHCLLAGDLAAAEAVAAEHPALLEAHANYYRRGIGYYLVGLLAEVQCRLSLARGRPLDVIGKADHLLDYCDRHIVGREAPLVHYWRGLALQAAGQPEAARASLRAAQSGAEALGAVRMLWPVLLALAELEPGQADALRQRAEAIRQAIEARAGGLSAPESEEAADTLAA
jgi:class 3 adenylate cyclase/tetratricopeptide (TPR) repeat protein